MSGTVPPEYASVSHRDVLAARDRIAAHVRRTPLVRSHLLSKLSGQDVFLKLETLQHTGSFKVRGALNKVSMLTPAERARGVVAASAGNHALGVAYACRALGVDTVDLFVQATAAVSTLNRLDEYPANLHIVGANFEEAQQAALQHVRKTGAVYVHAYDDPAVVAGQGTCGLEITDEIDGLAGIVVPVSGGGLIAGIAVAIKSLHPEVRVFGVNPEVSPSALLSLQRGVAVDPFEHGATVAVPLAGGFGRVPFAVASGLIDHIVLVSEEELCRGVTTLIDTDQVLAEPAGAAAVAALRSGKIDCPGRLAVVVSGRNIDSQMLKTVLAR